QVLQQSGTVPMIPVGLWSPAYWVSSLAADGTAGWIGSRKSSLFPGQSMAGYEILSRGLPGIRTFKVEPTLDIDSLPLTTPTGAGDIERYARDLGAIVASVSETGVTIGPTAPPAAFAPLDFVKTVISYKEQSVAQG